MKEKLEKVSSSLPKRLDLQNSGGDTRGTMEESALLRSKLNAKRIDLGTSTIKPERSKRKTTIIRAFKWLFLIIFLTGISYGGYFGYRTWRFTKSLSNIGGGGTTDGGYQVTLPVVDPELKKDSSGKRTNFLIVGIDSREDGREMNTDTLIIASYNHDTGETSMLSVPRDLEINYYYDDPSYYSYTKINGVYAYAQGMEKGTGLERLKDTLEYITGIDFQYYALIDFRGFKKLIDTVGGVEIDVETSFTDYDYPLGDSYDYETVSFEAGLQTMDGETALKYARSRHGDNGEGSDYMRARRQQKVISAVKQKVLSTSNLLDPTAALDILASLEGSITISEFNTEDIQAAIALSRKHSDSKQYSFVLDPNFAGGGLIEAGPNPEISSTIQPTAGIDEYEAIRTAIVEMFAKPALYSESAFVFVYDTGIGYTAAYNKAAELREQYPYLWISYQGTLYSGQEGEYIYDSSDNSSKSVTVNTLRDENLTSATVSKPEYMTANLSGADVVILLGAPPAEAVTEPVE